MVRKSTLLPAMASQQFSFWLGKGFKVADRLWFAITASPRHERVSLSLATRWRIGISKSTSAGTSGARPPERLSATHLQTCLPWMVHVRTQRGAAAPRGAPQSPGGSGAARCSC